MGWCTHTHTHSRVVLPRCYKWNMSCTPSINVPPVFEETMIQVADRLDGPSGVEMAILTLPYRISEAMLTMMENIETINSKVRAHQTVQIFLATQNQHHLIW